MTAAVVVEDAARAADVVAAAAIDVAAPLEVAAAASDVLAVEVTADCAFTKQGKMCVHMSSPRRKYAPCRVLDEKDRILSKEQS